MNKFFKTIAAIGFVTGTVSFAASHDSWKNYDSKKFTQIPQVRNVAEELSDEFNKATSGISPQDSFNVTILLNEKDQAEKTKLEFHLINNLVYIVCHKPHGERVLSKVFNINNSITKLSTAKIEFQQAIQKYSENIGSEALISTDGTSGVKLNNILKMNSNNTFSFYPIKEN